MECGLAPSPHFGKLLSEAFEAQLEGAFHDLPGAMEWLLREHHLSPKPHETT
jgi:hypothetical protein